MKFETPAAIPDAPVAVKSPCSGCYFHYHSFGLCGMYFDKSIGAHHVIQAKNGLCYMKDTQDSRKGKEET